MVKITFDLNEPKDSSKNDKAAQNGRTLSHSHWKSTMAGALHQYLAGLTLVDRLGLDYGLHPLNVDADGDRVASIGLRTIDHLVYVEQCADDPFEDLDEILGDYANTGKQITGDEITGKQMVVHVGNSSTVDDVLDLEMLFETEGVGPIGKKKVSKKWSGLDYDPEQDEVFDDDEHIVEDVHVSMNNFCFTADPKHDLSIGVVEVQEDDLDAIDYDSFGCPWPGQILTAIGVDANNGIYPVAYAIVEAESKASWCGFLNLLGEDLGIEVVTPPKLGSSGMVTMGCYVKVQQSRYRKRS
ncbi:hypothetical protein Tco_0318533 [Tanacetum coccineum]